jgi:hypothetical protein
MSWRGFWSSKKWMFILAAHFNFKVNKNGKKKERKALHSIHDGLITSLWVDNASSAFPMNGRMIL